MDKRNLPIGTVCDIGDSAKKIMIIGYIAVGYDDDLVKHDYYGCAYPQGITGISKIITFDAIDIENIYFTGYETEESSGILKKIALINVDFKVEKPSTNSPLYNDQQNFIAPVIETKKPIVSNGFIFDEDGYIIKEDQEKLKNPFTQNNVLEIEETKKENKWDIFKDLQFDENGVVIADGTTPADIEESEQPVVIPEHHEQPVSVVEVKSAPNNLSKIKFDENGFVVADNSDDGSLSSSPSVIDKFNKIKFDENGTVIEDGNESSIPETSNISTKFSGIKFDENGTVIEDGNESSTPETTNISTKFSGIKFDENGTVIEDGNEINNNSNNFTVSEKFNKIKFDENGFIVQE